jgi:1-acyl-sn-glycerol-3-phosphate acyltransferase
VRAHPWQPHAPCGPGCVGGTRPTVSWFRAVGRLVTVTGSLLGGAVIVLALPLFGQRGRQRTVRWLFRRVLRAIGARFEVHGEFPFDPDGRLDGSGALVVNNHISWLDIVAVNAVQPMRAQAKKELRDWPLIGLLATNAGTVYLNRESMRALAEGVGELTQALRTGALVNVCPEGTTWCGLGGGRFRPAMFQAAIDADVPVVPIVLRYRLRDGSDTTAPAFVGDETLLTSLYRTVRTRGLVVEARVLDAIDPSLATDRRHFAELAQAAVTSALDAARAPLIEGGTSILPVKHLPEATTGPLVH